MKLYALFAALVMLLPLGLPAQDAGFVEKIDTLIKMGEPGHRAAWVDLKEKLPGLTAGTPIDDETSTTLKTLLAWRTTDYMSVELVRILAKSGSLTSVKQIPRHPIPLSNLLYEANFLLVSAPVDEARLVDVMNRMGLELQARIPWDSASQVRSTFEEALPILLKQDLKTVEPALRGALVTPRLQPIPVESEKMLSVRLINEVGATYGKAARPLFQSYLHAFSPGLLTEAAAHGPLRDLEEAEYAQRNKAIGAYFRKYWSGDPEVEADNRALLESWKRDVQGYPKDDLAKFVADSVEKNEAITKRIYAGENSADLSADMNALSSKKMGILARMQLEQSIAAWTELLAAAPGS